MKTFKTTLLAAAATVAMTTAAVAGSNDAVVDDRGSNLINTWDNCVITKWDGHRGCHGFTSEARTVFFNFNSSALTAQGKEKLDTLAMNVIGAENIESVSIVGYADMIGSASYNQKLSAKRADVVGSYLAAKGINVRDARVEGLGERNEANCSGLSGSAQIACLATDRRVEVQLNARTRYQRHQ